MVLQEMSADEFVEEMEDPRHDLPALIERCPKCGSLWSDDEFQEQACGECGWVDERPGTPSDASPGSRDGGSTGETDPMTRAYHRRSAGERSRTSPRSAPKLVDYGRGLGDSSR